TVYTLIVTDKNGCKAKDDIKIIVVRGSITISKVVTNENTYKRFTINISGPNGKTWSVMVKEGESQTIENLIGGTYNLEEIVPANYKAVGSRTRTVTITSENRHVNVSFENERTNDDWFYDDHDKDNLFKVILGN
ncbi:MAG: SpaA isopeptide-forming pilin-related protein, partial [Senegalia sp. (in: firmicutes)]